MDVQVSLKFKDGTVAQTTIRGIRVEGNEDFVRLLLEGKRVDWPIEVQTPGGVFKTRFSQLRSVELTFLD